MSANSLANFGVPGLNGDRSAALHPIMTHKFRGLFFNFGASGEPAPFDMTRQLMRISRPSLQFETITMWTYVSAVYLVTRGEWDQMTIVFRDDITNTVMTRVQNQISKQQNFFDQTTGRAGENWKFEMDLDILAGGASAGGSAADPNILQKWCFSGCQIVGFEGGEFSYDNANAAEITLNVRYDNVIGFNQNGFRFGTFSHTNEIQSQLGVAATGVGASSGIGINIGGASVNIGGSFSLGGATISGSIGTGGGSFGVSF